MSRLSLASRDCIPQDQIVLFDALVEKHGVPDFGLGSMLAHAPVSWRIVCDLRDFARNESALSRDVVQLAVLVAGRELDCQFIWNAHAGNAGAPTAVIEALRDRTDLPALSDEHMAVIHFGRETYRKHRVSYGTFSLARELFGERGVVELGLLYGSHHMLALLLNASDAQLRPNRTELVLPVC